MKATIEMKKRRKIPQKDVNIFGSRVDCVYRYEIVYGVREKKSWLNSCKDKLSIIEARERAGSSQNSHFLFKKQFQLLFSNFLLSLPQCKLHAKLTSNSHTRFFAIPPWFFFFLHFSIRLISASSSLISFVIPPSLVDESFSLCNIYTKTNLLWGRERKISSIWQRMMLLLPCHSFHLHLVPVYVCLNCVQPSNFT